MSRPARFITFDLKHIEQDYWKKCQKYTAISRYSGSSITSFHLANEVKSQLGMNLQIKVCSTDEDRLLAGMVKRCSLDVWCDAVYFPTVPSENQRTVMRNMLEIYKNASEVYSILDAKDSNNVLRALQTIHVDIDSEHIRRCVASAVQCTEYGSRLWTLQEAYHAQKLTPVSYNGVELAETIMGIVRRFNFPKTYEAIKKGLYAVFHEKPFPPEEIKEMIKYELTLGVRNVSAGNEIVDALWPSLDLELPKADPTKSSNDSLLFWRQAWAQLITAGLVIPGGIKKGVSGWAAEMPYQFLEQLGRYSNSPANTSILMNALNELQSSLSTQNIINFGENKVDLPETVDDCLNWTVSNVTPTTIEECKKEQQLTTGIRLDLNDPKFSGNVYLISSCLPSGTLLIVDKTAESAKIRGKLHVPSKYTGRAFTGYIGANIKLNSS